MNNYDINSKGINIEVYIFYDTCQGRYYFESNFIQVKDDLYVYTSNGELLEECENLKDRIINSIDNNDYYVGLSDDEIIEIICERTNSKVVISRGYCQGDYIKVIVLKDELSKLYGKKIDISDMGEIINSLCWDTPIYGYIKINDNEFYVNEYLENYYKWDKEEFLEEFKKHNDFNDEVYKELEKLIPYDLNYL